MTRKKIGSDGGAGNLSKAGPRICAMRISGDLEKYDEIIRGLGITMLKLLLAGFRGDEVKRLTDKATRRAVKEIEQAGIEMEIQSLLRQWPPPPASGN